MRTWSGRKIVTSSTCRHQKLSGASKACEYLLLYILWDWVYPQKGGVSGVPDWENWVSQIRIWESKVLSLLSNKSFFLCSCGFFIFDECLRCVRVMVMSKCKPSPNNNPKRSTLRSPPLWKDNYLTVDWT